MMRLVALLLFAVALAGCRTPPPAMDPFLRTTVPAPGTTTGDQYYQGAAPAATPPAAPTTPTATPQPKYGYPAGSFNYHQSSIDRPKAVTPGASGLRSSPDWLARAHSATVPPPTTSAAIRSPELVSKPTATPAVSGFASMAALDPSQAVKATPTAAAEGSTVQLASGTTLRAESPAVIKASAIGSGAAKSEIQLASATQPVAAESKTSTAVASTPANQSAGNASAGEAGTVIRILDAGDSGGTATWSSQGASESALTTGPASAGANEITNLPLSSPAHRAAVRSTWTRSGSGSSGAGAVDAATANTNAPSTDATAPVVAASSEALTAKVGSYSYASDYSSLNGKLEYSQSSRQWKLRYIPIDGQTDRFGGSVVLPNSPLLEKCKPGDFVAVSGNLTANASATRGFSPLYDLRQVETAR